MQSARKLSTGRLKSVEKVAASQERIKFLPGSALLAGFGVLLAPLAEFDDLSAGDIALFRLWFSLERVGGQFNFGAVGSKLSDGARMALITGDGEPAAA